MRLLSSLRLLALVLPLVAFAPLVAAAQDAAAPATAPTLGKDAVLATVNGQPVTKGDLDAAFQQIGPQVRELPAERMLSALVDYVIDIRLAEKLALAAKIEEDADVARRMTVARQTVLYTEYFQRQLRAAVNDETIEKRFEEDSAKFIPDDEIRVTHILVATEEEAKAIVAELDQGKDFAEIAKTKSLDTGSATRGGELGFIGHGRTVPDFEKAAYALEVGAYTKTPVKSEFGWHIIKVLEKRKQPPPTLEGEKARIEQQLATEAIKATRTALREGAAITYETPKAPEGTPPAAETPAAP